MAGEVLTEDVQDTSTKTICPHYRVGFCRYKDNCKLFHSKENCSERKCRVKTCTKRHRRPCKYGEVCTWKDACEFLHDQQRNVPNRLKLEEIIKNKDDKIDELSEKIKTLEKSFAFMLKKVEDMKSKLDVVDSIKDRVDLNTAKIVTHIC